MALLDRQNKFIFFHLYKCGGTSLRDILKPYLSDIRYPNRYEELGNSHSLPRDIKQIYQSINKIDFYNSMFKFTFVRNPFDWLLSTYYYILKNNLHPENENVSKMKLYDFLYYYVNDLKYTNKYKELGHNKITSLYEYITDNNDELIVDYIGKYENIDSDMQSISEKIGVKYSYIPNLNVNTSKDKDYRKYYDVYSIDFVKKYFEKDLDYFNYTF